MIGGDARQHPPLRLSRLAQGRAAAADAPRFKRNNRPLLEGRDPEDDHAAPDGGALSRSTPRPTSPWTAATCRMTPSSTRSSTRWRQALCLPRPAAAAESLCGIGTTAAMSRQAAQPASVIRVALGEPLLRRPDRPRPAGARRRTDRRRGSAAASAPSSPTRTSRGIIWPRLEAGLQPRGLHAGTRVLPPGRGDQELRRAGAAVRSACWRWAWSAAISCRARRRRDRRPRRLCRQHPAPRHRASCRSRPRCWRRSTPPSAARPASTRRRARTWSAPSTSRASCWPTSTLLATLPAREFRAGYAEVAKYGLLGDAAFFAWLERNWQACSRSDAAALAHAVATSVAGKAEHRRPRRDRDRRPHAAQPRPHLRPRAGGLGRLFRPAAARRSRGHRHRAWRSSFSSELGLIVRRGPPRRERICAAVGLPTRIADIPGADRPGCRTLMAHHGAGQEGPAPAG